MEFLNGTTELKYLPDDSTSELLAKINKRIVVDGKNKGFICSSEPIPIFVGYKNFGIPKGSFEEYCTFLGVTKAQFLYNDELVNINLNAESNLTIYENIQPYIDPSLNILDVIVPSSSTGELTVFGANFDTYMNISMGDKINIDEIKNLTSTSFTVKYTASVDAENCNLTVSRGDIPSFGGNINIIIADKIIGDGEAGTFTTDFSNGGNGKSLWGNDWELEVFGNIPNINNFFRSEDSGTPSNGTGPNSVSQFTNSSYYAFTERSSANYGIGQYGTATTSNFKELKQIDFEWHFAGSSSLEFSVKGYNIRTLSWDTLWSYNGTGKHTQDQQAEVVSITKIINQYSEVQFYFGETNNYAADLALGNIVITSV